MFNCPGMGPVDVLTVDTLHCFYLGALQSFDKHLLWKLLLVNAWGDTTGDKAVAIPLALLRLKHDLMRGCEEKLTRIATLAHKMIGNETDKHLKLKGAETLGVHLFLCSIFGRPPVEAWGRLGKLQKGS